MEGRKLCQISYVFLCLAFLQTSIRSQEPIPTPELTAANNSAETIQTQANLIHPGDLIDVDIVGSLEYDWRGTLNPEGFLDGVDFIENPIYALCRSEEETAAEAVKAYAKILRDPQVVVKILDRSNRPLAFLNGAIKTPQRFQIKRPVFLNELLIISGGLTEKAGGEIQIFRSQNLNCRPSFEKQFSEPENGEKRERYVAASQNNGADKINIRIVDLLAGKKEANPQILSGDIITVLESDSIYVIGGVANPKQIFARAQMTLSRAIAGAGGATKNGDQKKIIIFRREAGETKIIEADLEKIKSGAMDDLVLRPFDIVEVGQTGREKSKSPPVLQTGESIRKYPTNLPLRIID